MRGKICALLTCAVLSGAASADPVEPARGSADRAALLANARTMAGYHLGAPVELVVQHMMVDGDRAFVQVQPQRPGGGPIVIADTPMVLRDGEPPSMIDGTVLTAYMNRVAGTWYVFAFAIGSTDAWWVGDPYCTEYGYKSVMPQNACPP